MPNSDSLHFFTIAARNYLAQAFVLGESVLRYHPDADFSIFLMDDDERSWRSSVEGRGFRAVYPDQIGIADYRKFTFQYNVTEACTATKPFVFQFLLNAGVHKAIYLDPDILCYRLFDEVLTALKDYNIVLTPHICSPAPDNRYPGEKSVMDAGVFNLGFIAVRSCETTTAFLAWWCDHLKLECIIEPDAGFFVDQKWIDLVPACFDGVFILRNRSYNIAYWNLSERTLVKQGDVFYEAGSAERVAFIHFSGFALDNPDQICKYSARNPFGGSSQKERYTLSERPDLAEAFHAYKQLLLAADVEALSKISYAYEKYDNGDTIPDLERSLYRTSETWRTKTLDPFNVGPDSFHSACRKAGLRASSSGGEKLSAGETVKRYKNYMRLIRVLLRCCLFILGPERYAQFAKYMRHQFLPANHGFLLGTGVIRAPKASVAAPSPLKRGRPQHPATTPSPEVEEGKLR